MFTETVSSRSISSITAAIVFAIGVSFCWVTPAPAWTRWCSAVLVLSSLGFVYRLIFPIALKLQADENGIRWWLGEKPLRDVAWREIRQIKQSREDDSVRLDTGRPVETRLPTLFLRSQERRSDFFAVVGQYRPDLSVRVV